MAGSNTVSEGIIKRLNRLEERLAQLELGSAPRSSRKTEKKLSLKEFLLTRNLTDDVKKTLAIGFFLESYEGLVSFNSNDLLSAFERAKEKKPLNINDKVNMNIRNGHMDESSEKKDGRKAWYLTSSGEKYVANDLGAK